MSVVTAFSYVAIIASEVILLRKLQVPIVATDANIQTHVRDEFKAALLALAFCPLLLKVVFGVGFLVASVAGLTVYESIPALVIAMTTSVSVGNPLLIIGTGKASRYHQIVF